MTTAMTVTYRVEEGLYVNMTNRCTNSCDFCIRNNGDGAYGSESLWLTREPSVEQTVAEILAKLPEGYRELVFCGYGEPSVRLPDCRAVALAVKEKYPDLPVRINTNGHSDLIFGENTAHLYSGAFDTVSISLNAPTAEEYDAMCHPVYGKAAFSAILKFAMNVKNCVHSVVLSVVRETVSPEELSACEKIAAECGVSLKVRALIK